MSFHRMLGDPESISDEFVGISLPNHDENLHFAGRQRIVRGMVR